ncbi:MAG: hypothetical protein CV087_05820 [Candidatus Brocadia sp. WS118]|nr:MAG: hypothetical protein CV087_05820 [Candidatus Brocadia sp. WS118]
MQSQITTKKCKCREGQFEIYWGFGFCGLEFTLYTALVHVVPGYDILIQPSKISVFSESQENLRRL